MPDSGEPRPIGGGGFVRVASLSDVPPGTIVDVEIGDEVVLIANVEGQLYAVSAWCTHQGTALALGNITGSTVTCYAHLWRYDVTTGAPIWPPIAKVAPGYRLRTYPVRVSEDEIYLSATPSRGN